MGAGIKWIEFKADGSLTTPWGNGKWGDASTAKKPSQIFAEFIGQVCLCITCSRSTHTPHFTPPHMTIPFQVHMLVLTGKDGSFDSVRCSDGETVRGTLAAAGQ